MKYKSLFLNLLILALGSIMYAQSNLDVVLSAIEKNNLRLAADRQLWEAQKLEFKTGLTLPNPSLQGQYLFGSPTAAGNQVDFFAVQPFDYPTTYKKRRELAEAQGALATSSIAAKRQEVLLAAKTMCLEIIYRNKLSMHFERRRKDLEQLGRDFRTKLDLGDGNVLDLNKVSLQRLEISQLGQDNMIQLQRLQSDLMELNGGQMLTFIDTIYPQTPDIAGLEMIEKEYEAADPLGRNLEQEKRIAEKQMELTQSWRLPKFELGYHYQGILGQRFNGVHAGLTLPIWEQKYRTELGQTQVLVADLNMQSHQNKRSFAIKERYDRQLALKKSMDEFQVALLQLSSLTLLDKALRLGEISTTEYFLERSFYQGAVLHFLKIEWAYHSAIADLTKYSL